MCVHTERAAARLLRPLCSFKEKKTISAQAAGGGTTANRGSREPLAQDRAKSVCQAFSKAYAISSGVWGKEDIYSQIPFS